MLPRPNKMPYNLSEFVKYANYLSLKAQMVEIIRNGRYHLVDFITPFKIRSNYKSSKTLASCNFYRHV